MLARLLLACGLALLLPGCLPESVHPLTPPQAGVDAPELLGVWRSEREGATLYIHALRGEGPELRIVAVVHEADGTGSTDLFLGHVSQVGPRRYINLQAVDAGRGQAPGYWIVGYELGDDDGVTLLFLSGEALAQAIAEGRLSGEVQESSLNTEVRITAAGEEIARYLLETEAKDLFGRSIDLEPVPGRLSAP